MEELVEMEEISFWFTNHTQRTGLLFQLVAVEELGVLEQQGCRSLEILERLEQVVILVKYIKYQWLYKMKFTITTEKGSIIEMESGTEIEIELDDRTFIISI